MGACMARPALCRVPRCGRRDAYGVHTAHAEMAHAEMAQGGTNESAGHTSPQGIGPTRLQQGQRVRNRVDGSFGPMGAAVSVRNAACARRMRLWDAAQRGDTLALRLHVRTTGERKLALNLAVRNDHLDAVCLLLSLPRQQKSALCRRDKHRSTLCRQDKHVWLNQFECDCACIMNCSWHLATPLQAAARYGSIGAVRLLCGAKATVDCDLWAHEKPLFLAAQHGHVDVLHVLLAAKATAHDPPSMFPPARGAVLHGHADALQVLLEADREIIRTNWATSCGQTLLMDAAQTGCASAVCVLLRAKACVGTRRRYDYCTAADLAADRGHQRIWRVLQIAAHDADSTQSADGTRNTNLEKALARLCDRH